MAGYSCFVICSPPEAASRLIRDLLELHRDWSGCVVLICSESLDSRDLDPFARRGASTGSLAAVEVSGPPQFVVEGSPGAVAAVRALFGSQTVRMIEIRDRQKPLFHATETLATVVMLPLLEAATLSLRKAGIPLSQARPLVESLVQRSVRAHNRSGRKTWRAPTSGHAREQLNRELESLRAADPRLCHFFEESLGAALRFFGESAAAG